MGKISLRMKLRMMLLWWSYGYDRECLNSNSLDFMPIFLAFES
jgi:hypothetical protein